MSPMHLAGSSGHLDAVRFLVEVGVNKDQLTTDNGSTPLHYAAEGGHLDIVCFLIEPRRISRQLIMGQHLRSLRQKRATLLLYVCWLSLVRTLTEPPTVEQPLDVARESGHGAVVGFLTSLIYIGQRAPQEDSEKRHAVTRIQKFREHAGEVWRTGIHWGLRYVHMAVFFILRVPYSWSLNDCCKVNWWIRWSSQRLFWRLS